ncbi:MAG: hypothetical protein NT107_12180 [Planctomycetota bacterium]|nr:hypothetical protein [Planctomycetota bacterium]
MSKHKICKKLKINSAGRNNKVGLKKKLGVKSKEIKWLKTSIKKRGNPAQQSNEKS